MKNLFAFLILLMALAGCKKDEVAPVENQFSFTIDSVTTECPGPFTCGGDPYFNFTGLFSEGQIAIRLWDFPGVAGEYSIDPAIPDIGRQVTIWKENDIYGTWGGLSDDQGSGKIIIEEVSDQHIKGRFECVFLPSFWHPATNASGTFQLARTN